MSIIKKIKSWFQKKQSSMEEESEVILGDEAFKIKMEILFHMDDFKCTEELPNNTFTAAYHIEYPDRDNEFKTHTLTLWNTGRILIDGISISSLLTVKEGKALFWIAEENYYKKIIKEQQEIATNLLNSI